MEKSPHVPACCAVTGSVLLAKSSRISVSKRLPELVCLLDCAHCCSPMWAPVMQPGETLRVSGVTTGFECKGL